MLPSLILDKRFIISRDWHEKPDSVLDRLCSLHSSKSEGPQLLQLPPFLYCGGQGDVL